ncbi:MAG TPA: 30S ribosomal protein S5 [Candidatus Dormibacteraeota bacterium]|nr:30S ribosomal protein S5 [Candidatus Dormibacteraeota bacterium]
MVNNTQRNDRRPRRGDLPQEEKQYDERTLHIDRVARVVKGGRRFRFRALVVVGDKKTKVGIGIAKGADVTSAVTKATDVAKKHMVSISLYKGTLPHDSQAKVGGSNILLIPASAGTGLIAGGVVRTILEVTGVRNALSKSLGSSNKANTAYATVAALQLLKPANEWINPPQSSAKSKPPVTPVTKTPKPAKIPDNPKKKAPTRAKRS